MTRADQQLLPPCPASTARNSLSTWIDAVKVRAHRVISIISYRSRVCFAPNDNWRYFIVSGLIIREIVQFCCNVMHATSVCTYEQARADAHTFQVCGCWKRGIWSMMNPFTFAVFCKKSYKSVFYLLVNIRTVLFKLWLKAWDVNRTAVCWYTLRYRLYSVTVHEHVLFVMFANVCIS